MRLILIALAIVALSASAWAVEGKYPLRGIRPDNAPISAAAPDPEPDGSSLWGTMQWGEDTWSAD